MKLKNTIKTTLLCFSLSIFSACSDFFDPDNSTYLDGEDYMKETSELYSGFVGVVTKLQAVGDKAIYLTDTRAEMFQPTGNSSELHDIYNYETNLAGNSYADPAPYYEVIIACNDYLDKAKRYKDARSQSVDESHYQGLISGILRIKAWTYFTLGKIYGKAVWMDEPMRELKEFPAPIGLNEIIQKCDELIEIGFDGVDGKSTMNWVEWITSTDENAEQNAGAFSHWNLMTPEYFALAADLELWKAEPNYHRIVYDLILPAMNEAFENASMTSSWVKWMMCLGVERGLGNIFNANPGNTDIAVGLISYNYQVQQMHSLYTHFRSSDRRLIPTNSAVARFRDPAYNPVPGNIDLSVPYDPRENTYYRPSGDEYYFNKYKRSTNDNGIFIYRSVDLYFMLIEAFNHLEKFEPMSALMHGGVGRAFPGPNNSVTWEGFTDWWLEYTPNGRRTYAFDSGVRGVLTSQFIADDARRNFLPYTNPHDPETPLTAEQLKEVKKNNDLEILKEIVLEQAGEGKTYPAMIRMARRYNDYNIIADLVCEKYPEEKKEEIRNKILNDGHFVPWDLDSQSSSH